MQPTRGSVDRDTAQAIADFHALETDLLNNRQLAEWLDLVTDDFTYIVPTPETPDTPAKKPWSERARIVDEDKWSLEHLWALRWRSWRFISSASNKAHADFLDGKICFPPGCSIAC